VICSCAKCTMQLSSAEMRTQTQNGGSKLCRLSWLLQVSVWNHSCHNLTATCPFVVIENIMCLISQNASSASQSPNLHTHSTCRLVMLDLMLCCAAEYIQELNMHQGLYSAVVRSLQHYDRLQSHSSATSSSQDTLTSQQVPKMSFFFLLGIFIS